MPSIQVTGILEDPITGIEPNAEIKIISKINYGQTTKNAESLVITDVNGGYDFPLVYGKHLIAVKYEDSRAFTNIGTVSIGDGLAPSVDLITLILLSSTEDDPDLVNQLQVIASEAAESAIEAEQSAQAAATSESNATTSAASANQSATNAANSESAAATSASNAATSESNAAGSAAAASQSESNAATSASNAAQSAADAQAAFDNFDDKYLGSYPSDPTTDNDGDPLQVGMSYWNSTTSDLYFYNGAAWESPELTASQAAQSAAQSAQDAQDTADSISASLTEISQNTTDNTLWKSQNYPDWLNNTDYPVGMRVFHSSVAYEKTTNNDGIGSEPGLSADWTVADAKSTEERLLGPGSTLYRGSNGSYVQNGDVIPAGTTHITALLNGVPTNFPLLRLSNLSQEAAGAISALNTTTKPYSVTIGGVSYWLMNSEFWYRPYVGMSIGAFWAEPNEYNTASIQAALDTNRTVIVEPWISYVDAPLIINSQQQMTGIAKTNIYGSRTEIRIERSTWTGTPGESIVQRADNSVSAQGIAVNNIRFRGYADIDFSDLSSAEDIQVHGVDVSGVRDGMDLSGSSFRNLSSAIDQTNPSVYLGFMELAAINVQFCYRAINANPTTGLSLRNSKIYDCYDWITAKEAFLDNVAFNNSSFSTETCSIKAEYIKAVACWFEGGNGWFNTLNETSEGCTIDMDNCILSEAYSAGGATKFMTRVGTTVPTTITMRNCRLPLNTRVTQLTASSDWSNLHINMESCQRVGNLWGGSNGQLAEFIDLGLTFKGTNNVPRAGYVDDRLNSTFTPNDSMVVNSNGVIGFNVVSSRDFTVTIDEAGKNTATFSRLPSFLDCVLVGTINGTTSSAFAKFTLVKGDGETSWRITDQTSGLISSTSVSFTNVATVSIISSSNLSLTFRVELTQVGDESATSLYCVSKSPGVGLIQ